MRYNGFLAADINGRPAPGFSSGQAQDAVERIAAETLPPGIGYEWTELTYQEILAGNSAMLGVPARDPARVPGARRALREPHAAARDHPHRADGLLAALTGVWLTDGDNNIFTQIGFMVLVGLSAKNAILIVEFARELEFAGRTPGAGRDRGEPAAPAADPHDLDRLRHGRGAARLLDRRRRRDAPGDGHRGVRRDDRRHRSSASSSRRCSTCCCAKLTGNRPLKHHGEVPHRVEAFAGGGGAEPAPAAPLRKDAQ